MSPLPLFLNEKSLLINEMTPEGKLDVILQFIKTLREAKKRRADVELHNSSSLYTCDFGGDYLCTILKGNRFDDHWRFVKTLAQRAPWDVGSLSISFLINGEESIGMALATQNQSATVSVPSEQTWIHNSIKGMIEGVETSISNLAVPNHVNELEALFRDYGFDLSPSSVIFQNGALQVRMFLNDHNPPHIHAELTGSKAKINIRTLDVMEGRLSASVTNELVNWTRQNREVLLQNWERCRAGIHPISVGN